MSVWCAIMRKLKFTDGKYPTQCEIHRFTKCVLVLYSQLLLVQKRSMVLLKLFSRDLLQLGQLLAAGTSSGLTQQLD